ncbi:MAG: sigma-70 family RNA polymerase sigma factor [Nibricoccus sp.]
MSQEFIDPSDWASSELLVHSSALRSYLSSRFPSLPDIDNIVQESLVRVSRLHERDHVESPKGLLFTTARNLALDVVRRQSVVAFEPLAENPDSSVYISDGNTHDQIKQKEEFALLTEAIQTLPEGCRRVLTLRVAYGLTQKEIALRLQISENTVEKHMSTGIRRCRDFFARKGLP